MFLPGFDVSIKPGAGQRPVGPAAHEPIPVAPTHREHGVGLAGEQRRVVDEQPGRAGGAESIRGEAVRAAGAGAAGLVSPHPTGRSGEYFPRSRPQSRLRPSVRYPVRRGHREVDQVLEAGADGPVGADVIGHGCSPLDFGNFFGLRLSNVKWLHLVR
jgi:hypothetical protein